MNKLDEFLFVENHNGNSIDKESAEKGWNAAIEAVSRFLKSKCRSSYDIYWCKSYDHLPLSVIEEIKKL